MDCVQGGVGIALVAIQAAVEGAYVSGQIPLRALRLCLGVRGSWRVSRPIPIPTTTVVRGV
jgi:hypothetical protein